MRWMMLLGLLLVGTFMTACPTPPNPPPQPPKLDAAVVIDASVPGTPDCNVDAGLPTSGDVCDGIVTQDGLWACVRCPGQSGCMDRVDGVYCAVGTAGQACTIDPQCKQDTGVQLRKTVRHKPQFRRRK